MYYASAMPLCHSMRQLSGTCVQWGWIRLALPCGFGLEDGRANSRGEYRICKIETNMDVQTYIRGKGDSRFSRGFQKHWRSGRIWKSFYIVVHRNVTMISASQGLYLSSLRINNNNKKYLGLGVLPPWIRLWLANIGYTLKPFVAGVNCILMMYIHNTSII